MAVRLCLGLVYGVRLCLLFGVLLLWAVSAQAGLVQLAGARAQVTVLGQTTVQSVTLPYHWDRLQPGQAGEAAFGLSFVLPDVPGVPYGLYIPRIGNTYEVRLNGVLLEHKGDLRHNNGANFANSPRYIVIYSNLLGLQNELLITIRTDLGREGGLSTLWLGPADEIYPIYLKMYRLRSTATFAVVVVSLLVGLMALSLWWTQTYKGSVRDPVYLFAGLAELFWAISLCDVLIEVPLVPWPWWGLVPTVCTSVWAFFMVLFCIEVAGWRGQLVARWFIRWLCGLVMACAVASFGAFAFGFYQVLTWVYAVVGLSLAGFVALYLLKASGHAPRIHKIVAFTILLNVMVGVSDLYVLRIGGAYEDQTYLRYVSILFGVSLAFIVITRLRDVSAELRELVGSMGKLLLIKEGELAQNYQQREQLARSHERVAVRTRILRDMHDGVGSTISTAIRQLESGRAVHAEVLKTLRSSLDHLKLSIDAMSIVRGDITAMLANLRYRLEPRLRMSDLVLEWDVDQIIPLPWMDEKVMRNLQFMVYEAVSNVLQHAGATELKIELHVTSYGSVLLKVIDNGSGFEVDRVKRQGLGSLRERADLIHAQLVISSSPGQTRVEIELLSPLAG